MYTQKALIAAKLLLDFDLSITNGIVSSISHFLMKLFLSPLLMVYIFCNLLNFARVCSNVSDFNNRNYLYWVMPFNMINVCIKDKSFPNTNTDHKYPEMQADAVLNGGKFSVYMGINF